jgi:hypothetical protein
MCECINVCIEYGIMYFFWPKELKETLITVIVICVLVNDESPMQMNLNPCHCLASALLPMMIFLCKWALSYAAILVMCVFVKGVSQV